MPEGAEGNGLRGRNRVRTAALAQARGRWGDFGFVARGFAVAFAFVAGGFAVAFAFMPRPGASRSARDSVRQKRLGQWSECRATHISRRDEELAALEVGQA